MVVGEREVVYEQSANDNYRCREENAIEDTLRYDGCILLARGSAHDSTVNRINTEGLAGRTCNEESVPGSVIRGDLYIPSMRMLMKRICMAFSGLLSPKKVLSVDWARGLVGVGGEGGVEVWKVGEGDRLAGTS